jgi:hypothetical protein
METKSNLAKLMDMPALGKLGTFSASTSTSKIPLVMHVEVVRFHLQRQLTQTFGKSEQLDAI